MMESSERLAELVSEEAGVPKSEILKMMMEEPVKFLREYGFRAPYADVKEQFDGMKVAGSEVEFELERLEMRAIVAEKKRREKGEGDAVMVRNRRYRAMKSMLESTSPYFSDEQMEDRDPLLFHRFIGRYTKRRYCSDGNDERNLSNQILAQFDATECTMKRMVQRGTELGVSVETDANMEEMLRMEERSDEDFFESWNGLPDAEDIKESREHFVQIMMDRFLGGQDGEFFEYAGVDRCEAYDDIREETQDAEDSYFDVDEEDDEGGREEGER